MDLYYRFDNRIHRAAFFFAVAAASIIFTSCGSVESMTTSDISGPSTIDHINTVDSISEMGVGDLFYITFNEDGTATMDFSGRPDSSKYTLILQSAATTSGTTSAILSEISNLLNEERGLKTLSSENAEAQEVMDDWMRFEEKAFGDSRAIPVKHSKGIGKGIGAFKAVGDIENFKILSSIYTTSSCNTVEARVVCVTSRFILYLDTETPSDTLTSSDIDTLCQEFDNAVAAEISAFGVPSDVNGDGTFTILLSPGVNRLGASGGGIITGYFYAGDLYSGTCSNRREILYTLVPDEDGRYGVTIPKEFAVQNLLTAVVPHELQHAINYNYHAIINGVGAEESWLNEALSHFAEDYVGYGQENPSRVSSFLESTASSAIIGNSNLAARGAEYLFMRYLYEQASNGDELIKDLVQTSFTGVENVENAFAGTETDFNQFEEYLIRWAIAMALTDTRITSDARYVYEGRTWNSSTSHWQGACLICDTQDGRGTVLEGPEKSDYTAGSSISIGNTAEAFIEIENPPSTINIDWSGGSGQQGVLVRSE